jgi:hyperosmotically inducible protein
MSNNLVYRWTVALGMGLAMDSVAATAQGDGGQMDAAIHKALDNKKFEGVTASMHGSDVVLTGTVKYYADKEDADRRVHHVKNVKGVDNEIHVAGGGVSDAALRNKLAKALTYDRVGYGTTAFNNISVAVQNGVVTISGMVYGPTDKASAMSLVSNTAGVQDVVDNLQVAPMSPMDDELRVRLAQAIYGAPQLQKYALDPARPIRITVVNGNVTLNGVVDNKMDRDVAGLRANGAGGAFKVTNNLQIEGQQPEK